MQQNSKSKDTEVEINVVCSKNSPEGLWHRCRKSKEKSGRRCFWRGCIRLWGFILRVIGSLCQDCIWLCVIETPPQQLNQIRDLLFSHLTRNPRMGVQGLMQLLSPYFPDVFCSAFVYLLSRQEQRRRAKVKRYRVLQTPFSQENNGFLRIPIQWFLLLSHWLELCHVASITAKESGKYRL